MRHWRVGYSAYELVHWSSSWVSAERFPSPIEAALTGAPFGQLELLFAFPEHKVAVPGRGGSSVTDLFVLGRSAAGELVAAAVEGKVRESFDKPVREWLDDPEGNPENRRQRLAGIASLLGLDVVPLADVSYPLLHRAAAALVEAKRYNAAHLSCSFTPSRPIGSTMRSSRALPGSSAPRAIPAASNPLGAAMASSSTFAGSPISRVRKSTTESQSRY